MTPFGLPARTLAALRRNSLLVFLLPYSSIIPGKSYVEILAACLLLLLALLLLPPLPPLRLTARTSDVSTHRAAAEPSTTIACFCQNQATPHRRQLREYTCIITFLSFLALLACLPVRLPKLANK